MTNDGNIHQQTPDYKIRKRFGHKNEERKELHVEQKKHKIRVMLCNLLKCSYKNHYKKLKRAMDCEALSFYACMLIQMQHNW